MNLKYNPSTGEFEDSGSKTRTTINNRQKQEYQPRSRTKNVKKHYKHNNSLYVVLAALLDFLLWLWISVKKNDNSLSPEVVFRKGIISGLFEYIIIGIGMCAPAVFFYYILKAICKPYRSKHKKRK